MLITHYLRLRQSTMKPKQNSARRDSAVSMNMAATWKTAMLMATIVMLTVRYQSVPMNANILTLKARFTSILFGQMTTSTSDRC